MNNDQRKIIGYNSQTGEPVYENFVSDQQINNMNMNNIGGSDNQLINYQNSFNNKINQSDMNGDININTINNGTTTTDNNQTISENNNDENSWLKILTIICGIVGFGVMYFNFVISTTIFIIGIILGIIYKQKAKKKFFGLILNIIGLLLNIILIFVSFLILNNVMNEVQEKAKCQNDGGYWENGKCVGVITNKEDVKKDNNSNLNDNSSSINSTSETYIGLWSCKDNGDSTSLSIPAFDQIDDSEYTIGLTFVDDKKYMITYSYSKWEKGTYIISLNKKESFTFYYDLKLVIEEANDSGEYHLFDSESKDFQFSVNESYSIGFIISKDGKIRYSCYKE